MVPCQQDFPFLFQLSFRPSALWHFPRRKAGTAHVAALVRAMSQSLQASQHPATPIWGTRLWCPCRCPAVLAAPSERVAGVLEVLEAALAISSAEVQNLVLQVMPLLAWLCKMQYCGCGGELMWYLHHVALATVVKG